VHPHATEVLPVLPRATAFGMHWLRVPLDAAGSLQAPTDTLAARGVPLSQVVLAHDAPAEAPEALCLTGPVVQAVLDDALHA
ncbi:hypothetical protein ACU6QR_00335, partial [Aeromonas veronii]|uniref:hypothetical protein n=1 Tax=Aeromonas veronii TaxID=654 RepID=UPI00406CAFAC